MKLQSLLRLQLAELLTKAKASWFLKPHASRYNITCDTVPSRKLPVVQLPMTKAATKRGAAVAAVTLGRRAMYAQTLTVAYE